MEEINPPVFYSTSKRYQAQVALSIDESENEVSYSDEDYEVIVTICQGESESEDGDEDKDVGTILVKKSTASSVRMRNLMMVKMEVPVAG